MTPSERRRIEAKQDRVPQGPALSEVERVREANMGIRATHEQALKTPQELEGDDLLAALGIEAVAPEVGGYTPKQERILAGFEDIIRFREIHGQAPQHGQNRDIFERIYAVRLDQIRKLPEEDIALLKPLDRFGLLTETVAPTPDTLSDDELLAALRNETAGDIGTLVHVQPIEARREAEAADYVADRTRCEDFDLYKPLFEAAEAGLATGTRAAKIYGKDTSIEPGDFFILGGQMVYVAAIGDSFEAPNGQKDARLRVIYANGTESNILRRSLQRALYKDEHGRRITTPDLGPLFGNNLEEGDVESGTLYVLRSLSTQPEIAALNGSLFKIGVTGGRVQDRIRDAERDPTFLLAPVEIVGSWKLANIHRFRLEKLLHSVLGAAQLQMSAPARFGPPVEPREWFVVPLPIIHQVVERIADGTLVGHTYDPATGRLVRADGTFSQQNRRPDER